MNVKSLELKHTLIMLTLGLTAIATMNDMVIIPVVDNLFRDFANVNVGIVNYIVSGPALIAALFSLLSGKFMEHISKKALMAIGFSVFAAGAILGDAVHNAYYMVVMRTLVGIGMGVTLVVAMAIIADTFVSEDSRSTMMGIFTSSATVVAALLGFASGIVAAYGWRLVYRIYLLSLPILFMVFLFLPQDKATSDTTEESSSANEKMPWGRLLFMAVALLIFNIVYCIVYYQVSMIITEKEIGDTRVIGAAASSGAIGGIIGAAILGLVYPRLKRFTTLICYGGMTISFFLLIIASRASLAIVACALIGISYSLGTAYYMMYCTTFVPPGKVPLSISITTTAMSVGQFLSTYCATALQGILNTSTLTAVLPVLAAAVGAGVVISLVTTLVDRKKDSEAKTQPSLKQ